MRGHDYWDPKIEDWNAIPLDPLVESAYSTERNKEWCDYKESVLGPAPSIESDDGISLGKLSKESSIDLIAPE